MPGLGRAPYRDLALESLFLAQSSKEQPGDCACVPRDGVHGWAGLRALAAGTTLVSMKTEPRGSGVPGRRAARSPSHLRSRVLLLSPADGSVFGVWEGRGARWRSPLQTQLTPPQRWSAQSCPFGAFVAFLSGR